MTNFCCRICGPCTATFPLCWRLFIQKYTLFAHFKIVQLKGCPLHAAFWFLLHFYFICDLSFNRHTAKWNLYSSLTKLMNFWFISQPWGIKRLIIKLQIAIIMIYKQAKHKCPDITKSVVDVLLTSQEAMFTKKFNF